MEHQSTLDKKLAGWHEKINVLASVESAIQRLNNHGLESYLAIPSPPPPQKK